MTRLGLSLLALLSLSACSSTGNVSDRYAFWRDNGSDSAGGTKPNLGDVPVAPNTQSAQAELESIKQRLEIDRNNAYLAAQGYPIVDVSASDTNNASAPAAHSSIQQIIFDDELAPLAPSPVASGVAASELPAYTASSAQLPEYVAGNVQYNYGHDTTEYVYGNSAVQFKQQSASGQNVVAVNQNVTIDYSALGGDIGGNTTQHISPVGLSGQPLIYFKHGSARLGTGDVAKLRDIASQLKQQPQSVVVIGHASKRTGIQNPVAARSANLTISARRAAAVLRELARQGVNPDQIQVRAEGDTHATNAPETKDRRVDILFDR